MKKGPGFLNSMLGGAVGAALGVALIQWAGWPRAAAGPASQDLVQERILAEVQQIKAAMQAGPQPAAAPQIQKPPADVRLDLTDAASRGRADAKLVLVEFSDFDCPFCARFSRDTKDQLMKEYVDTGKVRYVFKHMPLGRLHPRAQREAEAAECARRQNRFWEIYPLLFTNQQPSPDADIRQQAMTAGVGAAAFDTCFAGQATEKVLKDLDEGARAGIIGTPTFFIGTLDSTGRLKVEDRLVGAEPIAKFKALIDKYLAGI